MKRISSILSVLVTAGFALFANSAFAVNELCTSTSGSPGTGLCTVSTTHTVAGGAFLVDRNMLITGTGKIITTGGNALSIEITAGDLTMQSGALIDGSFATGTGASILITLDAGDVDLQTGSIIRSNGKSGGAIKIVNNLDTATAHTFDIDGLVESVGSITGTGATQAPGGGTITIVAGCELTVSDTGLVSSRGADPGADLVHLEGCTVVVDGIVESTGAGHALPNHPANHCNLDAAAHPVGGASFFSACVEVWGNTVTINSISPHKGEVRTDPPGARNPGRGWIDVFANGDITLNNDTTGAYSVHANSATSGPISNSFGGLVTVKSYVGKFTASGFALQANGNGLGSDGGDVIVQAGGAGAAGDVAFGSSSVQAKAGTGGNAQGGHISAKSFNGSVTGTFVTTTAGELNAANGVGATVGTVLLEACVGDPAVTYAGTVTGTETDHGPGAPYCGGNPSFSSTANWSTGVSPNTFITVTAAACPTRCGGSCSKSGTKFNDLNDNNKKDAGEPGIKDWEIKLWNFNQTAVLATTTTLADGSYSFTGLAPDTYVVCETPQAGWNQTFPVSGSGIVSCANGTKGYQFTLSPTVNQCTDTGNDFGNNHPVKKSGLKFSDTAGDGIEDPPATDPPVAGWPINLYLLPNLAAPVQTTTTAADGTYSFTIAVAGNYQVCEGQKGGVTSTQTFPNTTHPNPPPAGETVVSNCPGANVWGYTFTVDSTTDFANDDFGNHITFQGCQKQTTIDIMNAAFPGNAGPDVTVKAFPPFNESVQAAVDGATDTNGDHYVIIMVLAHADGSLGGTVPQQVIVSKDYTAAPASNYPFALFGCSVTMTGGGTGPAVWVQDTAKGKQITINGHATTIFVADLHGGNSAVGDEADGTMRYFRNIQPNGNGVGMMVVGNSNTIHNGAANNNTGDGVNVSGNSNYLTDTDAMGNGGNGFTIVGNNNQALKLDAGDKGKGNTGDGVNVNGTGNLIQEVDAYANSGNGIVATGGANTLNKNVGGDRGKGNGLAGFSVGGTGGLTQNTAIGNTGFGFDILSGGHTLKNNVSGGTGSGQPNGGSPSPCQYNVAGSNTNSGGNTSNGVTVAGNPFPTGCTN